MRYTLYRTADGSDPRIVQTQQIAALNTQGGLYSYAQTADDVDPATHDWSATALTWTPNPARQLADLKRYLVTTIKDEAERRQMLSYTRGGAKKRIYARQDEEVANWYRLASVGSTVAQLLAALALLPVATQKRLFRFAMWSAKIRGETTIAAAIARFESGMSASDEEVGRVEAIAQERCDAVKAATTIAQAQSLATTINWSRTS